MANAVILGRNQYGVPRLATGGQTPPGSGTQYTVLAATTHCRIRMASAYVTWTVQPSPLEIHLTVDGVAITHTVNDPVSATWYYASLNTFANLATQDLTTGATTPYYGTVLWEGTVVSVTTETTGGTVTVLGCNVIYDTLQ